jgi:hypothetical protein
MDASTTTKRTRIEQCKINAKTRSELKRQAVFDAVSAFEREKHTITKAAVARRAGVSVVFLRKHPDLIQAIEGAEKALSVSSPTGAPADKARDQVIAALRRRLEEMKQHLADKETELRQKQRDIDRLYGKLAAASPLTDAEMRRALIEALQRLTQAEESQANA